MLQPGHYKAKAVEGDLGFTNGGNEQVAVAFEVTEGDSAGQTITWHGYFTEKTADRTIESLIIAGWDGEDMSRLDGLGSTEVTIVVEHEVYNDETRAKVKWVNRLGGGLAMKSRMNNGQKASFANRFRGKAAAIRQKMQQQSEDDSFNFGANARDLPPGV